MLRILYNSRSAMNANQEKLEAISNNLANMNTEGYKRIDVNFKDLVQETLQRQGYPVTENPDRQVEPSTGGGVRTTGWVRDNSQGILVESNLNTNFAIDGNGFFRVVKPDGTVAYTRSGLFNADSQGQIVDSRGNTLEIVYNEGIDPKDIKFSKENFLVDSNGNITYKEGEQYENIGKIQLYSAIGSNSFRSIGDSLYVPEEGVQVYAVQDADIKQGFVEGSNVDMVQEFNEMIWTQRAFELGSRGIKTADEMWGMVNNLRGR